MEGAKLAPESLLINSSCIKTELLSAEVIERAAVSPPRYVPERVVSDPVGKVRSRLTVIEST